MGVETVIGLLHPGDMGSAIGRVLREHGHTVVWSSSGRSAATAERAESAGLVDVGSIANVVEQSSILLSVCPPHAAVDVARAAAGFSGVFVDANAVSPTTARKIAGLITESGGDFVDGGIVGPPPNRHGTTRLYLSGGRATAVGAPFAGTRLEARVIGEAVGAASALKTAYAAWTKGSAALLLATRALARAEGVEGLLLRDWAESLPDLQERSRGAAGSASAKGWRWIGEMEEIAQAMAAAGLPPGFHQAAAEVFRRSPRAADAQADDTTLEAVTAALLAETNGRPVDARAADASTGEVPGQTSLL